MKCKKTLATIIAGLYLSTAAYAGDKKPSFLNKYINPFYGKSWKTKAIKWIGWGAAAYGGYCLFNKKEDDDKKEEEEEIEEESSDNRDDDQPPFPLSKRFAVSVNYKNITSKNTKKKKKDLDIKLSIPVYKW